MRRGSATVVLASAALVACYDFDDLARRARCSACDAGDVGGGSAAGGIGGGQGGGATGGFDGGGGASGGSTAGGSGTGGGAVDAGERRFFLLAEQIRTLSVLSDGGLMAGGTGSGSRPVAWRPHTNTVWGYNSFSGPGEVVQILEFPRLTAVVAASDGGGQLVALLEDAGTEVFAAIDFWPTGAAVHSLDAGARIDVVGAGFKWQTIDAVTGADAGQQPLCNGSGTGIVRADYGAATRLVASGWEFPACGTGGLQNYVIRSAPTDAGAPSHLVLGPISTISTGVFAPRIHAAQRPDPSNLSVWATFNSNRSDGGIDIVYNRFDFDGGEFGEASARFVESMAGPAMPTGIDASPTHVVISAIALDAGPPFSCPATTAPAALVLGRGLVSWQRCIAAAQGCSSAAVAVRGTKAFVVVEGYGTDFTFDDGLVVSNFPFVLGSVIVSFDLATGMRTDVVP